MNIIPSNPADVVVRDTSNAIGRRNLTDKELATLIGPEVLKRVQAGKTFTAFDVTFALRLANPGAEIGHERCKALVHIAMNYFLIGDQHAGPTYDKVLVNRGWSKPAWEYFPKASGQPAPQLQLP